MAVAAVVGPGTRLLGCAKAATRRDGPTTSGTRRWIPHRSVPSEARQDGFHQAENLHVNLEPTPTPAPKATAPTTTGRAQCRFFCGTGR